MSTQQRTTTKPMPPMYDPCPPGKKNVRYRADFLWKHDDGSIEEAGYEFANARTEAYREQWWEILKERIIYMATGMRAWRKTPLNPPKDTSQKTRSNP